jgi:hypothetical protein
MPYVLNVLYDTGLGPVTLDPTYYRTPATPTYPRAWLVLTAAAAASLAVLGVAGLVGVSRAAELRARLPRDRAALLIGVSVAFVLNVLFEVVFSHLAEGGLFDRHILSALLPLLPALAIALGRSPRPPSRPLRAAAAGLVVAGAIFSIAATRDYLAWNRVRWELGRGLLDRGVDPLEIAGGFEFNGWHNYDAFRARGGIGKVYFWWHDDRRYLIALEPEPGYRIESRRAYYSWVHRRKIPVYALVRDASAARP